MNNPDPRALPTTKGQLISKAVCFLKSCLFFVSWIQIFGKRYKNDLKVIFDQWPRLYLGVDAETETEKRKKKNKKNKSKLCTVIKYFLINKTIITVKSYNEIKLSFIHSFIHSFIQPEIRTFKNLFPFPHYSKPLS